MSPAYDYGDKRARKFVVILGRFNSFRDSLAPSNYLNRLDWRPLRCQSWRSWSRGCCEVQSPVKVDELVTRIAYMAVVEEPRKRKVLQKLVEVDQRGSKEAEEPIIEMWERVQRARSKVRERVSNALRGCRRRLGALPCLRQAGEASVVPAPTPAPAPMKDGGDADIILPGTPDAAPRARPLRMDVASCYVPHHGEDAHFCHSAAGVIGVADGVGSYRKKGVDAGAFARALMGSAFAAAKRAAAERAATPVCPAALLRGAYEDAARSLAPGASTAVIVSLHGATLKWACVGDSGFAVLRGGRIVHRSRPQQHRFNCPYQLRAGGGDRVADAEVGETPVADGDVVVVGTDGLFDNVFGAELEALVQEGAELGLSAQDMADSVAATAWDMSLGTLAHSPSSIESWRNGEEGVDRFYGGKIDDITVVVAFIVSS